MIQKTKFQGLYVIKNKKIQDQRGFFMEIMRNKDFKKNFPFVICSHSKKNIIRGLHMQKNNSQGKYLTVMKGKIFDVSLDLRKNSKTFGKIFKILLSEKNCKSIFIPEGFAHGFCSLTDDTLLLYSCTKYRDVKSEIVIRYNDENLKINWPSTNPIVSKKDLKGLTYKEYLKKYF